MSEIMSNTNILRGPFLNPMDPEEVLWVEDGQMFKIIYKDTFLLYPYRNKECINALYDEGYYTDFKSAPILPQTYFNQLKSQLYVYGEMSNTDKKRLRYKIINYLTGSDSEPAPEIHIGTNEVQYVDEPIPVTKANPTFWDNVKSRVTSGIIVTASIAGIIAAVKILRRK